MPLFKGHVILQLTIPVLFSARTIDEAHLLLLAAILRGRLFLSAHLPGMASWSCAVAVPSAHSEVRMIAVQLEPALPGADHPTHAARAEAK